MVTTAGGGMRVSDYLPTRTFELTVHCLDIARATGLDFVPPDRGARRHPGPRQRQRAAAGVSASTCSSRSPAASRCPRAPRSSPDPASEQRARVPGHVDGVLLEPRERDDLEGARVGRREYDRRGEAVLVRLQPPRGDDAPTVARGAGRRSRTPAAASRGRCRPRAGGAGTPRSPPRRPSAAPRPRVRTSSSRRGRSRSPGRCRTARARHRGRCARSWPDAAQSASDQTPG